MANIQIKDLKVDVELDRKAMGKIIGGRGPDHHRILGIGVATKTAMKRFATGAFCGKQTLFTNK